MLFRRISQHIKEQNWFAVGLDFLIVVFGVFVAFQVDSWNERRKERIEENVYLLRLHNDMLTSIKNAENTNDFLYSTGDRAGIILRSLDSCEIRESDRDNFVNGLYLIGRLNIETLHRSTIDELQSTGKLLTLENPEVNIKLNEMMEQYDRLESRMPRINARIIPHINYIESNINFRFDNPIEPEAEIRWQDAEFNLQKLCVDNRFYNAISTLRRYTYGMLTANDQNLAMFNSFLTILEDELDLVSSESQ